MGAIRMGKKMIKADSLSGKNWVLIKKNNSHFSVLQAEMHHYCHLLTAICFLSVPFLNGSVYCGSYVRGLSLCICL